MRIHEIRLHNFRAFEELELQLEPQLTVLIGRNGAGKTTVLEGLAVALGAWLSWFSGRHEDYPIARSAAHLRTSEHDGVPSVESSFPVLVHAKGEVLSVPVEWSRALHSANGRTIWEPTQEILAIASVVQTARLSEANPIAFPVVAYYGTGRLWLHKRDKKRERGDLKPRLEGYRTALAAASDQKGFETWMAWREEDRVQRLARAAEEGRPLTDVRSPELEAVSGAACGCLEGARRIYYSANYQELRVDFENGPSIPFHDLSDGQRNLIAVAADIAWRATQLNPHLGAEAPAKAEGVVLIDEVDLHLHPAWQRRVLEDLTRVFPGIQFVVTTHSPQVMSTAPPGSVRLIDSAHQVHRVERTMGKDTNSLLEDILGVPARPREWQDKLDELARRINDGELAEAKVLLAELASSLGEDDAQVVAARWELSMAETGDAAD